MCMEVHEKETKLREKVRLRGLYSLLNQGRRVWTARDGNSGEVTRKHTGKTNRR